MHKKETEKWLGERITFLELKASGACNDAYYIETENDKKFIIKKEKTHNDFTPQNSLRVEAGLIKQLSKLSLSVAIPKISFMSKNHEMFGYEYIEGKPLISVWKKLSKKDRIRICKSLGAFHSEIGKKVSKQMAKKCGIKLNNSTKLHPEVEKEYKKILTFKDIPVEFIKLAQKAKTIFDQTLDLGVFQFIHNDAHHENIIIKNKKIAGIIDFGESEFGEIAKEFSRYIRDFHEYAEFIIKAYEKVSGNKLSRKRLMTNSFLSGFMENVEDYRKGGKYRLIAIKSVRFYEKRI